MGYNTSALFVLDRTPEAVLAYATDVYEYESTDEFVDFNVAWGRRWDRAYTVSHGKWAHVWNPTGNVVHIVSIDAEETPGPLAGTLALAVELDSVQDRYSFTLYDDGRIVRRWVCEGFRVVEDVGAPLPAEVRYRQRRAERLELPAAHERGIAPDAVLSSEQRERQRVLLEGLDGDVDDDIDGERVVLEVVADVVGFPGKDQRYRVWRERDPAR